MSLQSISLKLAAAILCLAILAPVTMTTAAAQQAGKKPDVVAVATKRVSAVVQSIDHQTRMVTLKRADGSTLTFRVSERARNLAQVAVGDTVKIAYLSSVRLLVRKPEGAAGVAQSEEIELAPLGQKPSGMVVKTTTAVATVESIDYKKGVAKIKGPEGNVLTVSKTPEMTRFNQVKKGDQVLVEISDAIALSVTK